MAESCPVIFDDRLPSNTLYEFIKTAKNKPNEEDRIGERTARSYERNIRLFLQWLSERGTNPLEVESHDLEAYLITCRESGDKDKTIVTRRAAISRFYDELPGLVARGDIDLDSDAIPDNPEEEYDGTWNVSESYKAKKSGESIQYLTPDEVNKLIKNVLSPKLRNRLITQMLYQTAARVSELINIRHERDINRRDRRIEIPSITSKSSSRSVAYKPSLDKDLRRWIDGGLRDAVPGAEDSDYLFPTSESEKISRETIRRIVRKAADSAELNDDIYTDKAGNTRTRISPHILRHSMAVNTLKAQTMNVRELQEFLGHHSLSVTEEYLKIASDDAVTVYQEKGGPPEA